MDPAVEIANDIENALSEPAVKLVLDFIADSQARFRSRVSGVEWDKRMKARKTARFGVSYDYSGNSYPRTVMSPLLVPVATRVGREVGFEPNSCLLNFYPDGQSSMGYHSDSTEERTRGDK